ncbi:type VI secretion system baseplate subunit TssE [Noviherbaspirillum cavernae]|uniref:Type VI secretion system baseplate subunit TssE n=1 Tax=Noviherbaspirillum cavernae TaxID=2320862 RepID=A0A418X0W0_9BURK|nr:type VI secretion system baseplate subunit TssE [Noviherbaspirillum cavernae]RJG06137.1 type VI secretion system baseplate subunit TssE [Noviherbaspirillum cavernae]
MPTVLSAKSKFPQTLFERLADDAFGDSADKQALRQITAEEVKESVARDLESLLNSRCAFSEETFKKYPESLHSIFSYGMGDFVGLSLASPADRNFICRSLERTIAIHERRLTEVRASLELDEGSTNRLRFVINALLIVHPSTEPVLFDALLQPSTLQYSVSKSRRTVLS